MRVLCFHPALAPYRIDLFNILSEYTDLSVVFLQDNLQTQQLDQRSVREKAKFKFHFLLTGFVLKGRVFRFGLNKIVKEFRPDIVIGFEFSPIMLALCLRRSLNGGGGYKLWTTTDDRVGQVKNTHGMRKVLRNFILHHIDGCVVTDDTVASAIRESVSGIGRVAFSAVPIVHDTAQMRAHSSPVMSDGKCWRETLGLGEDEKLLLFVGRLVPVKNLAWLVSQMACGPKNVRLAIVGDGGEEKTLRAKVAELGISDRVIFVGRRENDSLYSVMSAADALVLCSHSETYGAVVAEALQWGTPCIINDRCGASVIINGNNGRVFKYNDSADFQLKLNEVLRIRKNGESLLPVDLRQSVKNLVEKMHDNA